MVDQIAIVTFTTPLSNTIVNVTSSEITSTFSAAIFLYSSTTTDSSNVADAILGIGFCAPDAGDTPVRTGESACHFARDGQSTTPETGFRHSTSRVISVTDAVGTGALRVGAVYSSSISGGVALSFTTTTAAVKVTAILFAGLTRAFTDDLSRNTVSATETTGTATPFTPDLVIFTASDTSIGADFSANGVGAHLNLGFGVNKTGLPQVCAYTNLDDANEPSDADGYFRSAKAFGHLSSLRADEHVVISAFAATGFTCVASAGTVNSHYLALKFSGVVRLACANSSIAASATTQTFTDFGFPPRLVLGMGTLLTTVDTLTDGATASCASLMVTGTSASRALSYHTKEGITPSPIGPVLADSHTRQEDVALLQLDHLGAVVQRATWVGATTTGFSLLFSTASSTGTLTALGIALAQVEGETETLSDEFVMTLAEAVSETESIDDGFAMHGEQILVLDETETIDDGFADKMALAEPLGTADPAGWIF